MRDSLALKQKEEGGEMVGKKGEEKLLTSQEGRTNPTSARKVTGKQRGKDNMFLLTVRSKEKEGGDLESTQEVKKRKKF